MCASPPRRCAAYVHSPAQKEDPAKGLCIGYDTRFGSKAFARACAEVVAATGIPVMLANDITPTPALSFGVRERARGGIMITSSHNPAQWNGVKYKAWYGGSGKPSIIAEIESYLGQPVARAAAACGDRRSRFPAALPRGHRELCRSRPDREIGHEVLHRLDVWRGRTIISDIFTRIGVDHVQIRGNVDPLFPGINPEPIEPHIRALGEAVVANGCDAGLCTDGDADRIGATDEHGDFVDPHKIFSCC
jgi:phosphomannomutase